LLGKPWFSYEMNQQEYFMRVQMMGQEAQKIEEQIQLIDQQIAELTAVRESINELEKNSKENKDGKAGKEILANLGKGIFARAEIKEKELFVNVGKEVVLRKTPQETIGIIEDQIQKMILGKDQFIERIQQLQEEMQTIMMQAQNSNQTGESEHNPSGCSHLCEDEDCECEEPCEECECEKKGKK